MNDARLRMADVVARVQIDDLLNQYCYLVDEARLDQLMLLFTPDCIFDFGHGFVTNGREELHNYLSDRLSRYSSTYHHLGNVTVAIDPDGENVTARSYVSARSQYHGTEFASYLWGRYEDVVVLGDAGKWQIKRRVLRALASEKFPVPPDRDAPFEMIERLLL